ncbi:unnamed protein product [Danaus chrysippus]|uniref:(African queen) hypothetical protein n=1 Tax=Danaus chrysippus TaxID=151541 RepID=A0A8J2VXZ3_9NEOP|nr:unnamed protein product [Danaus chrysippus]
MLSHSRPCARPHPRSPPRARVQHTCSLAYDIIVYHTPRGRRVIMPDSYQLKPTRLPSAAIRGATRGRLHILPRIPGDSDPLPRRVSPYDALPPGGQ